MINSSHIHPLLGKTPFQILTGAENSFYHPLLDHKATPISFSKFWSERILKLREINNVLRDKYGIYLSQKNSTRHTIESLGIKNGDWVWTRMHSLPGSRAEMAYLSSLMPRFKPAQVVHILGRTSMILKTKDTGRLISRALVDCYPMKRIGNWSNLFVDSLSACQRSVEEEEENLESREITGDEVDQLKGVEPRPESKGKQPQKQTAPMRPAHGRAV